MTKLQKIREERGLSQSRLGGLALVHPSAISKIEHKQQPCWPALRKRICQVLQVSETELFDKNGWPLEVKRNEKKG
ncbi:MAG: helix-turn-helix domain-containing protein [Armatimonadetes bacterium]|nr:helix-turn-helix domain-containing protein [Armatimonadota bacterium]